MSMLARTAAAAAIGAIAAGASAQIRITEWMYNDTPEWVEFTNVGAAPIDMTGWSYDDDSALPNQFDLSGFGVVQPGESVVITEGVAGDFRTAWGLSAAIKVLGGYTNNLGRADQINLFDNGGNLMDRLTYGDQVFVGSIRTQNRSGVPTTLAALGADNVFQWGFADTVLGGGLYDLSGIAGANGFLTNTAGQTGNPGYFVPAPGAGVVMAGSLFALLRRRRSA